MFITPHEQILVLGPRDISGRIRILIEVRTMEDLKAISSAVIKPISVEHMPKQSIYTVAVDRTTFQFTE